MVYPSRFINEELTRRSVCVHHHISDQWHIQAKILLEEIGSGDAKFDVNYHKEEGGSRLSDSLNLGIFTSHL